MKRLLILLFGFSTVALAVEDPPNCSLANGGLGNTSIGGINFTISRAHVGDVVTVVPVLGMAVRACNSINTTGSIYLSTGLFTNFMVNVTLNPDGSHTCPADPLCNGGPYSFTVTTPMVGAGVSSPLGSISGSANAIRAVENGFGKVTSGPVNEDLSDFHSASLAIAHPCIQVGEMCGQSCIGSNVNFTGYVLNCGDITLTNVTASSDRTTLLNLDGSTLSQPFTLTNSQTIQFKGSFTPSGPEIASNQSTNSIVVMGTDTTPIGGPRASVTNSVTTVCSSTSCNNCSCFCFH